MNGRAAKARESRVLLGRDGFTTCIAGRWVPFFFSISLVPRKTREQRSEVISTNTSQRRGLLTIHAWFNKYDVIIPGQGLAAVAFLFTLFPERKLDRVFSL